jgi:type I restriction enzyme S subunit
MKTKQPVVLEKEERGSSRPLSASDWSSVLVPDALERHSIGRENQILASDIKPVGRFPVIDQGQAFISGYSDEEARVIRDGLPLVIFGDHTRCFKYIDFPFILGADGTKVLRPTKLFDPSFFYFGLRSLDIPNRGYNRHFTVLKEKSLPRPPLPEQQKIAAVLRMVQRALELQERLLALTGELKKTLLHQLFATGLRNEPKRQTDVGPIPESWDAIPLGQCCEILSGSMSYTDFLKATSSTNPDSVSCMAVKVSDMNLPGNEDHFVTANASKRLPLALAAKKLLPARTLVFPKRGAAIATNKKRVTTTWTVLDPNLIGVRCREAVDPQFLYHWSQTFDLRKITDPGPTPQLNKKDLVPLLIPVPRDIEEQRKIAGTLDFVDQRIRLHRRKHAALAALFSTLLHQLMTAQIRVHNLHLPELEGVGAA